MPRRMPGAREDEATSQLHVGIEARYLFAGEKTGIENYTTQLVAHLGRLPDLPPVTLYTDSEPEAVDPATAEILQSPRFQVRVVPRRRLWLKLWLPLAARRDGVTVMHFPGSILSLLRPYRTVVTLYDLCNVRSPELALNNEAMLMNTVVRQSALQATRVIAISQATATDTEELYGVPRARIAVTPLAQDAGFHPVVDARAIVAERYNLRQPYLLFVGTPYPRKNFPRLLEAFAASGAAKDGVVLAVASRKEKVVQDVRTLAQTLGIAQSVRFLGNVPDADLPALYTAAQFLAHPALYEGFGLTLLEAMACGTPVLTSNASVMPEVAGDAAVLVNPEQPAEIAAAIRDLLDNPEKREALAGRARQRAAQFTWENTARLTLDVYREAYASHGKEGRG